MSKSFTASVVSCGLAAALLLSSVPAARAADDDSAAGDKEQISIPEAEERSEPLEDTGIPENPVPEDAAIPENPPPEEPSPPLSLADIQTVSFQDLPASDGGCIQYTAYRGLLSGTWENHFDPDGLVSMAVVLTALYRMSGETAAAFPSGFSDVPEGQWYTEAVGWAAQNGIVTGRADGTLRPLAPITRSQLAALFYRFAAGAPSIGDVLSAYQDGASVEDYARQPVAWALEHWIFAGMVSDTIHPELPVSRAQLAQSLVALTACMESEPLAVSLTLQLHKDTVESVSKANHDAIQQMINKTAAKYGAVGVQVAVVEKGVLTDSYNYGYAVKNSVWMTSEHKIRCASITKVAVGMAAMLLREQGLIDLDKDISAYWGFPIRNPYYPNNPITIRNLLSHTSSLRVINNANCTYSSACSVLKNPSSFTNQKPGSMDAWAYNNYGFSVIGMTLEQVSGRYLDDIMKDAVWDILGIQGSFVSGSLERTDLIATIYNNGSVGYSNAIQASYLPGKTPAAKGTHFSGGMTMSATDVAKMAALLANDGYYEGLRLLSPESVRIMETGDGSKWLYDGGYQALPLRLQYQIYGRDMLYYHTGYSYGTYNLLSYDPDKKDAVVVLTTGASSVEDSNRIFAICGEISHNIYDIIDS